MAILLVTAVVTGSALWSTEEPTQAQSLPAPRSAQIDILDGPNDTERVQIDATLYAPAHTPAPAILLTHGFGEDKSSVADQAKALTRRGFTVLTYSSRGFGASSGRIALNSPEHEVSDASQILDWLASQPEVQRDRDQDPRVGVTGKSYGGALSLLLAGTDKRVDAIAPVNTYNDLEHALLPNHASRTSISGNTPARGEFGGNGVFKRTWAGLLFSSGSADAPLAQRPWPRNSQRPDKVSGSPVCFNFTPEVCEAYDELARTGKASESTKKLLEAASPKSVTDNIDAPTLLIQGEHDTLFGLDQADANARQISRNGTEVKSIWHAGGHDRSRPTAHIQHRIADWFDHHLADASSGPDGRFIYDVPASPTGTSNPRTIVAPAYPGIRAQATQRTTLPLQGTDTVIVNPPGGTPAATSSLPGTTSARETATSDVARDWPGQVAVFRSPPVMKQRLIAGVPTTKLAVSSVRGEPAPSEAVLFTKLYDVAPDGERALLGNAVAPMRIANFPDNGKAVEVEVALPGVVHSLQPEHRLELAVTTTDQAYAGPEEPAVYRVEPAGSAALSLPSVPGREAAASGLPDRTLVGVGGLAVVALLIWVAARIRRRLGHDLVAEEAATPLLLNELTKSYSRKNTAVANLSMRLEAGQIVGLLGPNGAGKSTVVRMLLGLVRPTSGTVRMFGHRIRPGAPVLSRVGALVETPGFLPHLTAADNLQSYWEGTGRPADQAHLDAVLEITGLTQEAHRKVRSFSQGMCQRLAISQAMLGMPDLLILDEPANGLDPAQIRQLREILLRYAATGRSILLSSHLLSEIEQICTHVVVMHRGKLVTCGPVEELTAHHGATTFEVDDAQTAVETLRSLEGVREVVADGELVHAALGPHTPAVAINALVGTEVAVYRVAPRRQLEDTFLNLIAGNRTDD